MRQFDRIESYNKKYSNELENAIREILPNIINAFVMAYGEQHRGYITYTLTNLKYVFFLPEDYLQTFSKERKYISNSSKYIIKYYLRYLNYLEFKSTSVTDENLLEFITKNYIARSTLNTDSDQNLVVNNLELDCPVFTFIESKGSFDKVIFLPLFIIDLKTILHEMNHAINNEMLAIAKNEKIEMQMYSSMFTTIDAEELVNDYIAELVLEEFLKLGVKIPKCLNRFIIGSNYELNYHIVEYYFDRLGPLILESLITGNHRKYWNLVGKKNNRHLGELMHILYRQEYTEERYQELIRLVDKMYHRMIEFTPIDYESFYQELESSGYRVRKLK